MIHVRRHQRETASGKVTTVRAHEREGGSGEVVSEAPGWVQPARPENFEPMVPPPTLWQDEDAEPAGDWWDVEEVPPDSSALTRKDEAREWRARDVPLLPPEPMSPQMEKLMGCGTPEGREKYERLRAYREAGYTGPLDQDNRIPDPDDPASSWAF